jgi:hypothetical protein
MDQSHVLSLLGRKCFFFFFFLQTNEGEIRQACHGEKDESRNFLMFQSILNAALTYVFYWEGRLELS